MDDMLALNGVLALGVDPHRESLDVIGIRFPKEIVLDEAFDNTPIGHHTLWSKVQDDDSGKLSLPVPNGD